MYRSDTTGSESNVCKVHIKSLVGRFIPTCEEGRGKHLLFVLLFIVQLLLLLWFVVEHVILDKTEVNKELNQVYLYLKNSPLVRIINNTLTSCSVMKLTVHYQWLCTRNSFRKKYAIHTCTSICKSIKCKI